MVLVIVAHEPNCFIDLEIVGGKLEGKTTSISDLSRQLRVGGSDVTAVSRD
jgi:hypothetical protein